MLWIFFTSQKPDILTGVRRPLYPLYVQKPKHNQVQQILKSYCCILCVLRRTEGFNPWCLHTGDVWVVWKWLWHWYQEDTSVMFLATASVDQTWRSSRAPSAIFAFLLACLEIPTSSRSLIVELVTKAPHPHLDTVTFHTIYRQWQMYNEEQGQGTMLWWNSMSHTPDYRLQKELHAKGRIPRTQTLQ